MSDTTLQRPDHASGTEARTEARAEAPRRTYPLNALRALAAVSVLAFHAYQHSRSGPDQAWPWAGAGHDLMLGTEMFVEMFFLLSGLVLWLPLARSVLEEQGVRSGKAMLLRRVGRLLPLYYTVVLLVWAVTNPALPGHWQDLLLHLTFTHVYSDQYIFWTNGPAWTLAVEFHFYLLLALCFPLVQRGAARWTGRGQRLALLLAPALLLLSVGVAYDVVTIGVMDVAADDWSVWFSPLSRAGSLACGMLLAVAAAAGVRLGALPRRLLALVGIAALAALVLGRPDDTTSHWWPLLYAVALAVALAAVVLHDGPWARPLTQPGLAWLGALGYGVYLIHEPVLRVAASWGLLPEPRPGASFLLGAVVVLVPTVALAWLSARTVEAAGLRMVASTRRDGRPRDYYAHLADEPV